MGWKGRNAGRDRDPGGVGKEDGGVKKSGMRGRTVYDIILGGKSMYFHPNINRKRNTS